MSVLEHTVVAGGLRHHVLEWPADGETVLLGHGFLDLGWSWKAVAERLQAAGYRCVAWDWRGFGETEHVGRGGYYHFPDYVRDLEDLVRWAAPEGRVHLVGHSMGGTVATMYAGVRSDRLLTLTLVEGLGPPSFGFDRTPEKFRAWLRSLEKQQAREPRSFTLRHALSRMRMQNPELPEELGLFLAEKSTAPNPTEELPEGRSWRFDRLHRTTSPMPFRVEVFAAFLKAIEVPTLVVGGEKGFRLSDEAERVAHLRDARLREIPEVGHMIHWLAPDALADAWLEFV